MECIILQSSIQLLKVGRRAFSVPITASCYWENWLQLPLTGWPLAPALLVPLAKGKDLSNSLTFTANSELVHATPIVPCSHTVLYGCATSHCIALHRFVAHFCRPTASLRISWPGLASSRKRWSACLIVQWDRTEVAIRPLVKAKRSSRHNAALPFGYTLRRAHLHAHTSKTAMTSGQQLRMALGWDGVELFIDIIHRRPLTSIRKLSTRSQ